jgi:hypothetical protein
MGRIKLSDSQKKVILDKQDYECARCKARLFPKGVMVPEFDHIMPVALGGKSVTDNAQVLCPNCHRIKTIEDRAKIADYRKSNAPAIRRLDETGARTKKRFVGAGIVTGHQTPERRKLVRNELKPYVALLSSNDSEAKAEALKQLSGMAFTAAIETDSSLLPNLARLVNDENLNVRRAALFLFERLSWRILPSYRTRYTKILLPMIIQLALKDEDMEVKKNAIEGLVASKASDAVDVFVRLLTTLTDEQYKRVIQDNTWSSLVYNGFGPKLRQNLLKAYEKNGPAIRERISRETANRYLG